jgi:hypothetical protein
LWCDESNHHLLLPDLYDESREANVPMALCKDCHSALIALLAVANPDGTCSILYGVENGVPDEWSLRFGVEVGRAKRRQQDTN